MEHPNHGPGWQGCHNCQSNGVLQSLSPGLGRNKMDTVRGGQIGQGAVGSNCMETHQHQTLISATFKTINRRVKARIIQCYAPTNDVDDEVKARFYDSLNHLLDSIGARDLIILMGDFNAKIGGQNEGYEAAVGKHGVGKMNENGEKIAETCVNNNLVIG